MGNQLVSSVVKVVIRPIDYYLAEVPEFKLKVNLGQTQFLKVALCQHAEGDVVVKVLSHEDPSLLLEAYKRELEAFAKMTAGNVSIAAFRIAEIRPNFAYLVRQYVRFSLYDRLLTRPFLTHTEKCWLVYQVFKCMAWCHEKGIQHGDLKLENVMVTSSLWVVIADFSTYKPVSLPEDNPSFFNYFFDTSRRRCCNIAPERFVSSNLTALDQLSLSSIVSSEHQSMSGPLGMLSDDICLTSKMDMFSIGCMLAEIFSDHVLFDLSGLLHYKEGKTNNLISLLKQISNETIRDLVANLTNLNPNDRKSCQQVLAEQKGKLFPSYFDKLYVLMRTLVRLPPDAKILYLSAELELYLPMMLAENSRGVLILLNLVTSSLRALKHIYCKVEAQRVLCQLVASAPATLSPFITDRLIPYLANCLLDEDHRVRGEAILSMTQLLEEVNCPPSSDNNLFTDYLLEILANKVASDRSTFVRICLARCIGRLSGQALHFLNQSIDHNYDEELNLLHSYFQNLVSQLLTDSNNCVRRALLMTPENCAQLCTFFGRQKTNEVILSHIITFLNDKSDFQLRLSFFDNIIVIASYLGVQCSPILYPLLQQGLCDGEELIIARTISSIAALCEQGILQKSTIYDLLQEILPLLCHPNTWISHALVHLFSVLAEHLSFIDLNCKVAPLLKPYLTRPIYSLGSRHLLYDALRRSLPRNVFDTVMDVFDYRSVESLILVLTYRDQLRRRLKPITNREIDAAPYRRLLAENITDEMEEQLLRLSDLLQKIHRNRRCYQALRKNAECGNVIAQKHTKLGRSVKLFECTDQSNNSNTTSNQEWQHMFGPKSQGLFTLNESAHTVVEGQEAREIDFSYFECPPYGRDVKCMLMHKKDRFLPIKLSERVHQRPIRPRGFLVSHLQEHRSAVNQMARFGESSCFFTASDDGTIRLWDLAGFENRYVINRSKYLFKMEFSNGSAINFKGLVCCGQYLVSYTSEGIVVVFECDAQSSGAISHVCSFKAGSPHNSVLPLITSLTALSETMFAVSLTDSTVFCYDIRSLDSTHFFVPVFKLRINPNQRTITAVTGNEVALFAGTSHGYVAAFDLRFQLKVNYFNHPSTMRIARLALSTSGLYSSVYGSAEVILWDYKLGQRLRTLRPYIPVENQNKSYSINAEHAILPLSNGAVITGGSGMRIRYWDMGQPECSYIISDPSYKACNFSFAKSKPNAKATAATATTAAASANRMATNADVQSGHLMAAADGAPTLARYAVSEEQSDQSLSIEEIDCSRDFNQYQSTHYCTVDQQFISTAHHDTITDLLQVNQYLLSAGRNGTVKVWR